MGLFASAPTHRVAIFGLTDSGRSAMLYKLAGPKGSEVVTEVPTIGIVVEKVVVGGVALSVVQWSPQISTPTTLRLTEPLYKDATCIVLVVDAAAPERITEKTPWNRCGTVCLWQPLIHVSSFAPCLL